MATKYNKDNFFLSTSAIFTPVAMPKRKPDFVSDSGSKYWYTKKGVVRASDHWGMRIASCNWALLADGETALNYLAIDNECLWNEKAGFCKWSDFASAGSFPYEVYANASVKWSEVRNEFNLPRVVGGIDFIPTPRVAAYLY